MLIRIVKLHIKEEHLPSFFEEFNEKKLAIVQYPGCIGMRLLHDLHHKNIIMTYSHWDDLAALERYRASDLFSGLWTKIKPMFGNKPEAWSHEIHFNGFEESKSQ